MKSRILNFDKIKQLNCIIMPKLCLIPKNLKVTKVTNLIRT